MKDQNLEYEGEPRARGSGFVSLSSNLSWLDDSEAPHATCDTFVATTLVQWMPSMTMNGTPRPSLASPARCQTLSLASCVGHAGGRDTCRQTRECERAPSGERFAAMDEAEFWGESPGAAPKPPSDAFSVKQRESHPHQQAGSVHNLIAPSQRWWEAHATGVAGVEGPQAGGSRTPSLSMLSPNSPLSPRSPSPEPDAVAGERAPGSVPSAGQECPREQVWANELLDYAQSASVMPFLVISWQHRHHARLTFVSPQAQPQASIVNLASQVLRLTLEKNGLLEALEHEKRQNAKLRSTQRSRQKV
jgi:hypothetical protein